MKKSANVFPAIAYMDEEGKGYAGGSEPWILDEFETLVDAVVRARILAGKGCKQITLFGMPANGWSEEELTWDYVKGHGLFELMSPILFNTEMTQAILEDRKSVIRRVIKPQPKSPVVCSFGEWQETVPCANGVRVFPVPYRPGDVLYVRETYKTLPVKPDGTLSGLDPVFYYRADGDLAPVGWRRHWTPSIHMPKEAARIFLQVKGVRIERLQDMTQKDAEQEGMRETQDPKTKFTSSPLLCFYEGWKKTLKPEERDTYGWDANPWVWVIEFERIDTSKIRFAGVYGD